MCQTIVLSVSKLDLSWAPSTLRRRNFKTEVSLLKRIKYFPSTLRRRNLKMQQSPVILDLCFEENLDREITWLSWCHRFRKAPFSNVFRPLEIEKPTFPNSFGLKSVFQKLRFRDGLVWTVDLTVEIKLRFQNVFTPTLKHKAGVSKFLRSEERLPKAPFSWRISVDGRPSRRNKTVFKIFLA